MLKSINVINDVRARAHRGAFSSARLRRPLVLVFLKDDVNRKLCGVMHNFIYGGHILPTKGNLEFGDWELESASLQNRNWKVGM